MGAIDSNNIFHIPETLPGAEEYSESLFAAGDVRIERIISHGHRSPEDSWYDQADDEWVALLQGDATLVYDNGREVHLRRGDWLSIPARTKHRVGKTSIDPPCVWLAVHVSRKGIP